MTTGSRANSDPRSRVSGQVSSSEVPGGAARSPAAPALDDYPPLQVTEEFIAASVRRRGSRHRGQRVGNRGFCCVRVAGQQRSQLDQRSVVSLVGHAAGAARSRLRAEPGVPSRCAGVAQRNSRVLGLSTWVAPSSPGEPGPPANGLEPSAKNKKNQEDMSTSFRCLYTRSGRTWLRYLLVSSERTGP